MTLTSSRSSRGRFHSSGNYRSHSPRIISNYRGNYTSRHWIGGGASLALPFRASATYSATYPATSTTTPSWIRIGAHVPYIVRLVTGMELTAVVNLPHTVEIPYNTPSASTNTAAKKRWFEPNKRRAQLKSSFSSAAAYLSSSSSSSPSFIRLFSRQNRNRAGLSVVALLSFSSIVFVMSPGLNMATTKNPRYLHTHTTKVDMENIMDLDQFKGEHAERLFWGTYRPHLYLGVRSRTPQSLLAGLMWFGKAKDGSTLLRHTCEHSDDLRYGWVRHDGDTYGRQEIFDGNMKITTWFMKNRGEESGYGGDWVVRVKVEDSLCCHPEITKPNSFFFYLADEEQRGALNFWPKGKNKGPFLSGFKQEQCDKPEDEKWNYHWELHAKIKEPASINYVGGTAATMENLKGLVLDKLMATNGSTLGNAVDMGSNIGVLQITGKRPITMDFVFLSGKDSVTNAETRVANLSGERLSKRLVYQEQAFEDRFENKFNFSSKYCSSNPKEDERSLETAKAAFSNLIGGIGYFHGHSLISLPEDEQGRKRPAAAYWDASLFTAVPCRPFFPRGFLWDEGFHQLIISKWDRNISYDIIGNWLDLMNVDGWIPREQILGEESKSKVPPIFIEQHPDNANPPTFFFVYQDLIQSYLNKETSGEQRKFDIAFLEKSFPRLKLWYNWFNTTQLGRLPGSYYWHGREASDEVLNVQTLTSGLDDYPRASHPTEDERHVDLRCWMAFAAKAMALIAKAVGQPYEEFNATAVGLSDLDKLNELHYDKTSGRYYDYGYHTEECEMHTRQIIENGEARLIEHRVVTAEPKLQFIPHFGYVSLFPLMMKLIPADSPILKDQLELLRDEKLLWSGFGLRSLATDSSLYNAYNNLTDHPYWRGTVWVNFNYLTLAALKHYSSVPGPYNVTAANVYKELREGIISNMVEQYHKSGFIWEQYDNNRQGKGKGAHPFTGWSALLMLIMAESY